MASPEQVVGSYFSAWTAGDLDTVRGLLHDDLHFKGPIDEFHNADDYLDALERLKPIFKDAKRHKLFVDGNDVCTVYDFVTDSPIGTAPIAEWHRVRGDKIAEIRLFFDARPFAAMAGA
jgi:hypothetical protein